MAVAVEGTRLGQIYAHDNKQYRRWRSEFDRLAPSTQKVGLTGLSLEQHVAGLHRSRPDIVSMRV